MLNFSDSYKKFLNKLATPKRHLDAPVNHETPLSTHEVVLINDLPAIQVGQVWEHRESGNQYQIEAIANGRAGDTTKYPVTLIYLGADGLRWARPAHSWHASMAPVKS